MRTYQVKKILSVPITISYVCEHCGHENIDKSQELTVSGSSGASFSGRITDEMKADAGNSLEKETDRLLYDIRSRRYQKLGMTCACENCRKRQTWSSFLKSNTFFQSCLL